MKQLYCLLILLLMCSGSLCLGQNRFILADMEKRAQPIAKTSLSFEMGGNGLLYSFNYDRVLFQMDYYKATVRLGAALLPYPGSSGNTRLWLFVPAEFNNLFGPKNHFFEFSLGTTYTNSLQGSNWWMTGRLGYRLQPFKTGFFFRTGLVLVYMPYANPQFFRNETQDFFIPVPSVAWGISF